MQHQQQSFGGKGLTMTEVVQFLESIQPSPNSTTVKPSTTGQSVPTRSNNTSTSTQQLCPLSVAGVVFPLTSGALIAAAYLEWLVTQQSVPALIHDEYLGLLAQGLVAVRESTGDTVNEREVLANLNDLLPSDGDTLRLFKIYRRKLQHFLQVHEILYDLFMFYHYCYIGILTMLTYRFRLNSTLNEHCDYYLHHSDTSTH